MKFTHFLVCYENFHEYSAADLKKKSNNHFEKLAQKSDPMTTLTFYQYLIKSHVRIQLQRLLSKQVALLCFEAEAVNTT
jgi:uncharacterized protein (DUF488 family)